MMSRGTHGGKMLISGACTNTLGCRAGVAACPCCTTTAEINRILEKLPAEDKVHMGTLTGDRFVIMLVRNPCDVLGDPGKTVTIKASKDTIARF